MSLLKYLKGVCFDEKHSKNVFYFEMEILHP